MNNENRHGRIGTRERLRVNVARALGRIPKQGPNFFVLGAARAGTTTLHHLLNDHPDIFMPRKKELHYFDNDMVYRSDLGGYLSQFYGYRNECAVGEVTPLYFEKGTVFSSSGGITFFNEEDSITRIARAFPHNQLIVSLRDPISRAQSLQYKNFMQGKVVTSINEEILDELYGKSRLNLIYRCRYDIHIKHILEYFSREQVLFLVFENWIQDLQATLDRVSDFLHVERASIPPDIAEEKQNKRESYKSPMLQQDKPNTTMSAEVEKIFLEALEPMYNFLSKIVDESFPWRRL